MDTDLNRARRRQEEGREALRKGRGNAWRERGEDYEGVRDTGRCGRIINSTQVLSESVIVHPNTAHT